ncbi:uncharacterized protein LOC130052639 [Ostrea edulis]|uniref:uncharacterized protein LOC130052639 n=1 Tax=Ostrea edulis TaxID=37623 RepID=UPI0024AF5FD9|nr:uncharacterized protein LOC130052639 [Ostrea edulis]
MRINQSVLYFTFHFICLFFKVSAQCESLDIQMATKLIANSRFNITFMSYNTIGRNLCIKECLKYPACLSVNFDRSHLKCELVSFSSDVNHVYLLEDSRFEHIVINKTADISTDNEMSKTTVRGKCNELFHKCVLTKSVGRRCLPEGKRWSFHNIARNKTIHSSSVWSDNLPQRGPQYLIDGIRTAINHYCAATKTESQPWFAVDLQNVYQIDHVLVYTGWNNGEPCNTYQVRVGVTTTWNEMTSCGVGSQAQDETIVCKDCLLGRYVQLQLTSTDASCHIVTCEIEVVGSLI